VAGHVDKSRDDATDISTVIGGSLAPAPQGASATPPGASVLVPAPDYAIGIHSYMHFETSDDPTLLYSAGHIQQRTVQDALDLELPQLCSDEFEFLAYSDMVHDEDMLRVGELCLYLPSLDEIRQILAEAPIRYGRYGMRSVRVKFRGA
jgi:hypothetical protein